MQRIVFQTNTILYVICIIIGQNILNAQTPKCGCCPTPHCQANPVPCSTNFDCECLLMTMTEGGLCADTVIPCNDLAPCENDNKTCLTANTIYVNNTRCRIPVCYPIERASSERCPPLNSTTLINDTGNYYF
ncbi:unnamed protein product [Rotaria magnacalcarata]|uniref:Uncharacterized protein n=1 Tax=Rotaria magnacalcarata TaxID=392030 RepID=A0A8S2Z014_9BILA|nr:unnamed protein product [Rotaria magnacalcarata]